MQQLREGQRVHVEYDGVVRKQGAFETVVRDPSGKTHYYPTDTVTITPADPVSWPPKVGDIWDVEGSEYYVRENTSSSGRGTLVIESFSRDANRGSFSECSGGLDRFKGLNPTLVRRRD